MGAIVCVEEIFVAPPSGNWNGPLGQLMTGSQQSSVSAKCEVRVLRMNPNEAVLKKHGLHRDRLAWVGVESSGAKLGALEDFQKQGSTVGTGLVGSNGYFWVVRQGAGELRRLADAKSAKWIASCPAWPVAVRQNAQGIVSLEFVGDSAGSWQAIFLCWNALLAEWGIADYRLRVHEAENAWQQLDVFEAGDRRPKMWKSVECKVVRNEVKFCEAGRRGGLIQ